MTEQPKVVLGGPIVEVCGSLSFSHTHTHTHTKSVRLLYQHYTQQTQETNIHALSGFRIRGPNNQAASDLRLRPHGRRDWALTVARRLYTICVILMLCYVMLCYLLHSVLCNHNSPLFFYSRCEVRLYGNAAS